MWPAGEVRKACSLRSLSAVSLSSERSTLLPAGTGGHLSVGVPEPVQMSRPPGGGPLQLFSQTLAA